MICKLHNNVFLSKKRYYVKLRDNDGFGLVDR